MKEGIKIVGRAVQQKLTPSHSQLCKSIVEYMHIKYPGELFFHISNEGKRSPQQGKKLKDEGMLPGVFDYLLCHVKVTKKEDNTYDYCPGIFIEVKTKKDKLSEAQQAFRAKALKAHYSVAEVYSLDEFIEDVEAYLK